MHVWLIQYGEPLPLDASTDRLQRSGTLAKFLTLRGHRVTWWTSTFDQYRKVHLFHQDTICRPLLGLDIRMLHTPGYRKHVSIERLLDHAHLGHKFARECQRAPKPDVIHCSLPTLELADQAVKVSRKEGIPVVIDVRDWWPDIFIEVFPGAIRPLARVAAHPMFRMASRACRGATAITGITAEFVQWGLRKARRGATEWDRPFPFGYQVGSFSDHELERAKEYWRDHGIAPEKNQFVICFFGTIGKSFKLGVVVEAARRLAAYPEIVFVICGKGDRLEPLKELSRGLKNILFPGWVDAVRIHTLMRMAKVGLDPMPCRGDFLASINNKAVEYLSAGLPVLSSPKRGALYDLIRTHGIGMSFSEGDAGSLIEAILWMYHHPEELKGMAARAKDLFYSTFAAEKVFHGMVEHLEQLVGRFRRGAGLPC